jgi:hypothetical protein
LITESKQAQARRHVAEGRWIVTRQRALVAGQKQAGRDTLLSENLLAQFERTLSIFEHDLRAIEQDSRSE